MKREKIVILLLVVFALFSGCKKNDKDISTSKKLELKYDYVGLDAFFEYDDSYGFQNLKIEDSDVEGISPRLYFEVEEYDVFLDTHFSYMNAEEYRVTQAENSKLSFYQDYKMKDYDGYVYSDCETDNYLYFSIPVKERDGNVYYLNISVYRLVGENEVSVSKIVTDKNVEKFFNSLEIKEVPITNPIVLAQEEERKLEEQAAIQDSSQEK